MAAEDKIINYVIKDSVELNLSFMPFITSGGLFIPTFDSYTLGDKIVVDVMLPGKTSGLRIEGKVIWITPAEALHHVLPGVGIQFLGDNASAVRTELEAHLDTSMEVGGYTYGISDETKKSL